tara:strand:+ start:457 stop:603 length:147 start_codon:yes stop_codon:yes gene_type:complete
MGEVVAAANTQLQQLVPTGTQHLMDNVTKERSFVEVFIRWTDDRPEVG